MTLGKAVARFMQITKSHTKHRNISNGLNLKLEKLVRHGCFFFLFFSVLQITCRPLIYFTTSIFAAAGAIYFDADHFKAKKSERTDFVEFDTISGGSKWFFLSFAATWWSFSSHWSRLAGGRANISTPRNINRLWPFGFLLVRLLALLRRRTAGSTHGHMTLMMIYS